VFEYQAGIIIILCFDWRSKNVHLIGRHDYHHNNIHHNDVQH
jgi:hypothetical protein